MMKKQHHMQSVIYDVQLLFPVLFLVGIGIVMVYSASSTLALKKFGTSYFFLKKQALFAFAGIIVLVISRHFPYKYYRMLAYPLLGLAMTLLAIIHFTDFGLAAGGSIRW
ncbi:MAG: FtsW/RodA/SpoVE family cell cycle protein, partial [Desulfobacterales bacterium]